jgi:sugar lactone lactonase YvrE
MRPEIHRLYPDTGKDETFPLDLPTQLGGLVPHAGGGLALAASDGITILSTDMKSRTTLVNPIASLPQASFNDAKCDRQGRLWAGTTDRLEAEKIGSLYRIDRDGTATCFADGFICSNGPSFSPDGRIMYHTCSNERTINAYDLDPVMERFRSTGFLPPSSLRPGFRTGRRSMPKAICGRRIGAAGDSGVARPTEALIARSRCRSEASPAAPSAERTWRPSS